MFGPVEFPLPAVRVSVYALALSRSSAIFFLLNTADLLEFCF